MQEEYKAMATLAVDVKYIKEKVDRIENRLDKDYVTIDQFTPVKNIVYGMVGLILTSVMVALITLVINK